MRFQRSGYSRVKIPTFKNLPKRVDFVKGLTPIVPKRVGREGFQGFVLSG
jgi:hypothetical protein